MWIVLLRGKWKIWFYNSLNFKTILINLLLRKVIVTDFYKLFSYTKKHSERPHYRPCCLDNYCFLLVRIANALCWQNSTSFGVKSGDTLIKKYARFQVIPAVLLKITSSGKWCCVVRRVVPDVSKYRSASFFVPTPYVNSKHRKVFTEWSRVTSDKK